MGDWCSNGVVHLEDGQAAEMWNERGEQVSEDRAGTDIFEEFSTLDFVWAPRPRFRLISQEGFFCR